MTYTYATVTISPEAYDEVKRVLSEAGHFEFAVNDRGEIDMHGLALVRGEKT